MLLTKEQLQRVCDDLYRDRRALREFNPNQSERAVVWWVLYGSLSSLLDVPPDFVPALTEAESSDPYRAGVAALLRGYAPETLAWQGIIAALDERLNPA